MSPSSLAPTTRHCCGAGNVDALIAALDQLIAKKRNLKQAWWNDIVQGELIGPDGKAVDMVGLDCTIIMNPKVWVASGHVGGFNDPMVDCKETKQRYRAGMPVVAKGEIRDRKRQRGKQERTKQPEHHRYAPEDCRRSCDPLCITGTGSLCDLAYATAAHSQTSGRLCHIDDRPVEVAGEKGSPRLVDRHRHSALERHRADLNVRLDRQSAAH